MNRILFLLSLLCLIQSSFAQSLTPTEIKLLANKVDSELRGVDMGNGISLRKCFAFDRTITYHYGVPNDWFPKESIKEDIIKNFKTAGFAETYFDNQIDVDFYYYSGSDLKKKISIRAEEFGTTINYKKSTSSDKLLGDYLLLLGNPKAKGVDLRIKSPVGWKVLEGDRPNVVVKFVKELDTYLILIKENITFFSKNEAKELFKDPEFKNGLIKEYSSVYKNPKIINDEMVFIDNYPALKFEIKGIAIYDGQHLDLRTKYWLIYYEDKIVTLQGSILDNTGNEEMRSYFFNLISNSIIFPEQYN